MLRVGLTFWLVVATAAGPWFCCCAADQVVTRAFALVNGLGHTHGRCECAGRSGHAPDGSREGRRPCNPVPGACDCRMDAPAKDDSSATEWTDAVRFVRNIAAESSWFPVSFMAIIGDVTRPAACVDMLTRVAPAFPRLSGRSILSAIQLFRC